MQPADNDNLAPWRQAAVFFMSNLASLYKNMDYICIGRSVLPLEEGPLIVIGVM